MSTPAVVLGIDLGGTNVRAGAVAGGALLRRAARSIDANGDEEAVLGQVCAVVDQVFGDDVAAIGCGVPSVVDLATGVVHRVENIPSWRRVPLKDALERRYQRPATINNDANCFVLGELRFGQARGHRDVVGLTLGTGLGAGVVCDGRLVVGANCGLGEIGSLPYRDGTLEQYAAGGFFPRRAGASGDAVFARARDGDEEAQRVFREYGHELGFAVLLVLYAYDPELVILGGSIARASPFFAAGLHERLEAFEYRHALARLSIVASELEDAAVLGAAALCLEDIGGRPPRT